MKWISSCLFSDIGGIYPATRSRKSSICSSVTRRQLRPWHTHHQRQQLRDCTVVAQSAAAAVTEWALAGRAPHRPAARWARCWHVTAVYYVITQYPAAATMMTSRATVRRKLYHRSTPCCLAVVERRVRMLCRRRPTRARRTFHLWPDAFMITI